MSNPKNEYEVEKIVGKRLISNKVFYKIKWKDYSYQDSTWEPIENLGSIKEMIISYEALKKESQFGLKKRGKVNKDESQSDFNSLTMLSLVETDEIVENELSKMENQRERKKERGVSIKPISFGMIENGDIPEEIIGISSSNLRQSELEYMVKWKRNKNGEVPFPSQVSSSVLGDAYPKVVIKYLESRINYI